MMTETKFLCHFIKCINTYSVKSHQSKPKTMTESRCVYIGNIPYDYTEEQVLEIAKSVAPVMDLRLLFDPLTGKSRGYAFIKYGDHESAASAVRNLNNLSIGNRNLKCSFSNDNSTFLDGGSFGEKLPTLPFGITLFPNQSLPQAITAALSRIDKSSALQLMKEAKQMSIENPSLMTKLLDLHPQLAHALVEICLLLDLALPETMKACVNSKQFDFYELTPDHITLLREVRMLSPGELEMLEPNKRKIVEEMREKIKNGTYGEV